MKKKLLFITPFSLCSNHAGVVYSRHLIEDLAQFCEIEIVSFHYKGDPKYQPVKGVLVLDDIAIDRMFKILGVLSLFWIFPLFSARFSWRKCKLFQSYIDKNNYDYIYFDFSQTFAYSLFLKHPHKIMMAHDVMAQKYSRMKKYLKPWAMQSESVLLKKGKIFTFSDKDCKLIEDLYHLSSQSTTFYLSKEVIDAFPSSEGNYVVFFGGWSREENYEALDWFITKVYPSIPNLKCKVIGGGLPSRLKKKIDIMDNIEYLGFVENPYPIISNAKAQIAPLRKGAGVKVKCIDSLGCGTPVIGTEVAFEGIPDDFCSFMKKADTPQEYVDAIQNLKISLEERLSFKKFFIQRYNNKSILDYVKGAE